MSQLEQLRLSVQEHLERAGRGGGKRKWFVAESPLAGRGIVAARDVAPGELLFVDRPLVRGPRSGAPCRRGCTVCLKLPDAAFLKCPECALLLCSEECRTSDTHVGDCSVLTGWPARIPIDEVDELVVMKALAPIRALLLDESERALLSSLQAHALPRHGSEIRDLGNYFEIPPEEERFMTLACRTLDANAFQIASPYGRDEVSARGLYPVSALMNHACVANTRHVFDSRGDMSVTAVAAIPAGAEVVTCYSKLLWGTPARRHHLFETKHFMCACARCADRSERGTNLAALKCFSRGCGGMLLPLRPLEPASPWCCGACEVTVPARHIGAVQSALGSLMGTLDSEESGRLEEFARTRLLKYIPECNQIYVDVQCRLIWLYGETPDYRWKELSETRLALKESLCRSVLRVAEQLGAGGAHLRGLLLYHLHATLAERARRHPHSYVELKPDIESTIEEAYQILEGDISAPPDLQLRRQYLGPGCEKSAQERLLILNT